MQLSQAETVGVFDHHDGGVGDVHSDLHHRGCDQQRDAAVGEVGHYRLALRAGHLAVSETDLNIQDSAQVGGARLGRR